MLDFDAGKLIVIGIVALIAIPSKDLPNIDPLGDVRGQLDTVRNDVEQALAAPVEPVTANDLPPMSETATAANDSVALPDPQTPAKAGGQA